MINSLPSDLRGHDLLDEARASLAAEPGEPTPARVAEALRRQGRVLSDSAVLGVVEALRLETRGAGPLEALIRQPGVTDVLVNGPEAVYVDAGEGLELSTLRFRDDAAVRRLAQRLAATAGRRLDDAAPYVDVRLPDGTRFHAVLAPVSSPGTCLSLRVPARRAFGMAGLVSVGFVDEATAQILARVVDHRLAFLLSGGTGSGKTTLLAAMLTLAPAGERIVIVEDAAELRPAHPHVVSLEGRPSNIEGAGAICLRDLVRQAMRMRPDRVVVGEVRGAEVVDLLAALNTGHRGGCGTLHANSAADVPARLEALAATAGLGREALHSQVAAALDLVIHIDRDKTGQRHLGEIGLLARDRRGFVGVTAGLSRAPDGQIVRGPAWPRLAAMVDLGAG